MNKFLKHDHQGGILFLLLGGIIGFLLLAALLDARMEGKSGAGLFLVLLLEMVLTGVLAYRENHIGLQFEGGKIYQRMMFRVRELDAGEITAIKVTKAVLYRESDDPFWFFGDYELTDEAGDNLLQMFFLKEADEFVMRSAHGDARFFRLFGGRVIGQCVYDQSVIDSMKERNPNLLVIPPEGLTEDEILRLRKPLIIERIPGPVRGWIGKTRMKE